MSGKHTSGPWVASQFGFQVLTGDSWNVICTLRGTADWEDGRSQIVLENEWDNQVANARLIAAAPEMLEALNWVLPMAKGYAQANPVGRNAEIIAAAEAIVAKAEGQS